MPANNKRGRPRKEDSRLPADTLRAVAFSSALKALAKKEMGSDRQESVLALLRNSFGAEISNTVGRWLNQDVMPNASNTKLLFTHFPEIAAWLKSDLSHPLRRLFCALDIWGSANSSPARGLGLTEKPYSIGCLITSLKAEWGLLPIVDEPCSIYGYAIPKLRRAISYDLTDAYQITAPLTVLNVILIGGVIFDDLTFTEIEHWAIDLATAAIVVCAHLESFPVSHQYLSGSTGSMARIIYSHFFEGRGKAGKNRILLDNLKTIEKIPDYERARDKLILAKKILRQKFNDVGLSLGVVEEIFENIPDKNMPWSAKTQSQADYFPRGSLYNPKKQLQPAYPGRFKYILQNTSEDLKVALCHDLWLDQIFSLPERHDLDIVHKKTKFDWGYSGSGPEFLAKSVLAHHLGHDQFGQKEVSCLLLGYLSKIPRHWFTGPFFLTTDMVDGYLNDTANCLSDAT